MREFVIRWQLDESARCFEQSLALIAWSREHNAIAREHVARSKIAIARAYPLLREYSRGLASIRGCPTALVAACGEQTRATWAEA